MQSGYADINIMQNMEFSEKETGKERKSHRESLILMMMMQENPSSLSLLVVLLLHSANILLYLSSPQSANIQVHFFSSFSHTPPLNDAAVYATKWGIPPESSNLGKSLVLLV